jgi:hypothetical protein
MHDHFRGKPLKQWDFKVHVNPGLKKGRTAKRGVSQWKDCAQFRQPSRRAATADGSYDPGLWTIHNHGMVAAKAEVRYLSWGHRGSQQLRL